MPRQKVMVAMIAMLAAITARQPRPVSGECVSVAIATISICSPRTPLANPTRQG